MDQDRRLTSYQDQQATLDTTSQNTRRQPTVLALERGRISNRWDQDQSIELQMWHASDPKALRNILSNLAQTYTENFRRQPHVSRNLICLKENVVCICKLHGSCGAIKVRTIAKFIFTCWIPALARPWKRHVSKFSEKLRCKVLKEISSNERGQNVRNVFIISQRVTRSLECQRSGE